MDVVKFCNVLLLLVVFKNITAAVEIFDDSVVFSVEINFAFDVFMFDSVVINWVAAVVFGVVVVVVVVVVVIVVVVVDVP